MNKQEMFEKAVRGVVGQGELARTDTGGCYYSYVADGGKELRCAVGHMVTETQARELQDIGGTAGDYKILHFLEGALETSLTDDDRSFLCAVQMAHDQTGSRAGSKKELLDRFVAQMKYIASYNGLIFPADI